MATSSAVSAGDDILASQYNNLRTDVLDADSGHPHDGTDGVRLAYAINKASAESVTNSSTLQNDDDFVFAMKANETWVGRMMLHINSDGSNGIKLSWSLPSGATFKTFHFRIDNSIDDFSRIDINTTNPFHNSAFSYADDILWVEFVIKNGGTAGNAQLQWAQTTAAAAESTTIEADSFLTAQRV